MMVLIPFSPFVHLWFVHMTVRWDGEKWEQGNKKKETAGISFYPCFYALFVLSTQTLLLYYLLQRQEKVLSFIVAPLNSVHFTVKPHFIHVCCMHTCFHFHGFILWVDIFFQFFLSIIWSKNIIENIPCSLATLLLNNGASHVFKVVKVERSNLIANCYYVS